MADEEQFDLFCTQCGQRVSKDTAFCPSCGAHISNINEEPTGGYTPYNQAVNNSFLESRLKTISIIMAVSAGFLALFGIFYLATADMQVDTVVNSPFWDTIVDAYKDIYTEDELKDLFRTVYLATGAIYLLTGICLAIAAICGFKKKKYGLGLACCIIATVLSINSLFGLIIGIIVIIQYTKTKPIFS